MTLLNYFFLVLTDAMALLSVEKQNFKIVHLPLLLVPVLFELFVVFLLLAEFEGLLIEVALFVEAVVVVVVVFLTWGLTRRLDILLFIAEGVFFHK